MGKFTYQIVLKFSTDGLIKENVLDEVAGAALVQLEALSDDHGISYEDAEVRVKKPSKQDISLGFKDIKDWTPDMEREWSEARDARSLIKWDDQTCVCGHHEWCGRDSHRPEGAVDPDTNSTIYYNERGEVEED